MTAPDPAINAQVHTCDELVAAARKNLLYASMRLSAFQSSRTYMTRAGIPIPGDVTIEAVKESLTALAAAENILKLHTGSGSGAHAVSDQYVSDFSVGEYDSKLHLECDKCSELETALVVVLEPCVALAEVLAEARSHYIRYHQVSLDQVG